MLRVITLLIASAVAALGLAAAESYMNIIAVTGISKAETEVYAATLERRLAEDPAYRKAKAEAKFSVISRPSGKYYIVSIEPLYDSETATLVLGMVHRFFPDAFVFTHRGDTPSASKTEAPPKAPEAVPKAPEVRTVYVPVAAETAPPQPAEATKGAFSGTFGLLTAIFGLLALLFVWYGLRQKRKVVQLDRALKEEHKALEAVIERQEDVMVNVGERIREPVKTISSSSERISQTRLNPLQAEELEKIRHSDALLLDITNDLIDFLNLKSNKVELRHELFNINNVLDEMAGTVSSRARGRRIEFIFDIEKGVPAKFIGDSLRLGQVLTNLLGNAMKFTEDGEVKLQIRRLPNREQKVMLEFTVSDTGAGIDPRRFSDIFEPFSSATDLKETGLGLYISRALIEMMGGTIALKSAVDKGSDFILTLPLDVPDVNEKRHYRLPAKAYTAHSFVIVEVQPSAADALKKMLEYFKNSVSVRTLDAIGNKSDILFESEVVIIAEEAFTPAMQTLIRRLKSETDNKVVLAGSMMNEPHDVSAFKSLIDARIMKPLNLQRVYDLIVDLFEAGISEVDTDGVTPQHTSPGAIKTEVKSYEDVPETPGVTKKSFGDFAGASVLVVEDNLINQKVLLSLFGGSGIEVSVAADGVEALEAVEKPGNRFDLVLMDINMPVMDGYEATRHIRAKPEFDTMPIVSLTGLGLMEEIAKMYALGMNAHLTKPVQVGRLYTVFERFVKPRLKGKKQAETEPEKQLFVNSGTLAAAEGLQRASNDPALYGEILEEFVSLYADAGRTLGMMMRTDDLEGAKQLCLDIKGVSANIGAAPLAKVCEALHAALVRGEEKALLSLTEQFDEALEALLGEIRRYCP